MASSIQHADQVFQASVLGRKVSRSVVVWNIQSIWSVDWAKSHSFHSKRPTSAMISNALAITNCAMLWGITSTQAQSWISEYPDQSCPTTPN